MWCLSVFVEAAVALSSNVDEAQGNGIQLQGVRISPGLKCMNNIIEAIKAKSIRSCIQHGMSLFNCHAVNYNVMDNTCQPIILHGVVMQTQWHTGFTLATFCNNQDFLKTSIETICAQSSVQWHEQFLRAYKEYDNLFFSMTLWGINRFVRQSFGTTNCPVLCKMPRKHAISCIGVTVVMLYLLSVDSWRQYHATNSVGELQCGLISPAKAIHRGEKGR